MPAGSASRQPPLFTMPELSPLFIYLFVATAFFAATAPRRTIFTTATWVDYFDCFMLSAIWPWAILVGIIRRFMET